MKTFRICLVLIVFFSANSNAQETKWAPDGGSYYQSDADGIAQIKLPEGSKKIIVNSSDIHNLSVRLFNFSNDQSKVLLYTHTTKVWRLDTRGDYWVFDLKTKKLSQLGSGLPASSLMFAKFSPDGLKAAYVYQNNVLVEDLNTNKIEYLTKDGTRKLINGTFDWAYEEEFACRDGFQWSPDSKRIAFWQVDATRIRDYNMINNVDSVYSTIIPVEYPTAGQNPSPVKIGIVEIGSGQTSWLPVPGDPQQHYIPRIEWNTSNELFVHQLNRKQNESRIFKCQIPVGKVELIYTETDAAWIDIYTPWENVYDLEFRHRFRWINQGKEFLWFSEKDGWRHLYRITKDGKETLITKGDFDVMDLLGVDEKNNTVYFVASPTNATQKYLFRTRLDGKGRYEQVSPATLAGTHDYELSPTCKFARHEFSNTFTRPLTEFISLPDHKPTDINESIASRLTTAQEPKKVEFFKIKTEEGVEMDAWMLKPSNFVESKKYPLVFLVYTEPWGANVLDRYGVGRNRLYNGDMSADGYVYVSIDNRGTPAPKGRAWRKSIYRQVGRMNIKDQALAAKEVMKWKFIDAERVAVWGWSGGGSATLNLLFQYPDLYKTGIAIAAVTNQLTYDNLYQERYMGLPQENREDFIAGSPLTYAKNLKGNLLYIHGTGDDNVHYSNAEMLLNELIKHNKQFQFMAYPNRTHSISEGEGTTKHLVTLYTEYLRKYCPPGGR